jgi:hypothetical protein
LSVLFSGGVRYAHMAQSYNAFRIGSGGSTPTTPPVSSTSGPGGAGTFTKVTAGLSLSFWLAILLLGRLLPAFEGSTHFF